MTVDAMPPLVLRPWRPDDRASVLEIFSGAHDLNTQCPLLVTGLEDADAVLERMLVWDDGRRNFAVTVHGTPVGNIGVTAIDRRHDTGWMSYFSAADVRGRGLVTRSAIAVANWALSPADEAPSADSAGGFPPGSAGRENLAGGLGLYRLELGHRVNNPASGRIAVAAGFVLEGREREKLRYGAERFDTLIYGRLAGDPVPLALDVTLET